MAKGNIEKATEIINTAAEILNCKGPRVWDKLDKKTKKMVKWSQVRSKEAKKAESPYGKDPLTIGVPDNRIPEPSQSDIARVQWKTEKVVEPKPKLQPKPEPVATKDKVENKPSKAELDTLENIKTLKKTIELNKALYNNQKLELANYKAKLMPKLKGLIKEVNLRISSKEDEFIPYSIKVELENLKNKGLDPKWMDLFKETNSYATKIDRAKKRLKIEEARLTKIKNRWKNR